MSTLTGRTVATTYKDLLQVSNNNIGIDNTIRSIEDGEGTQSALALSTDTLEIRGSIIPSTNSTFDIGSAERKIRHLYLSSNSLYVGDLQFSEQDVQEVKNVRGGAYATSTQGALAETALQPGAFAFESLSDIPTTLAGYGITDAATAAQGDAADTALIKASSALQPGGVSFTDDLTDRPTTIAGYGITDAFNGSFNNLANLPTSLGGYGIVDAATSAQGAKADSALQPNTNVHVNSMHVSGGMMYGPATMYIDPEAIGDNTGKLVILGDLQVDGVTTTVNSTTVSVSGKTIELAGGANDPAVTDGAGVTVAASDASMLYKVTTDSWNFNKTLTTTGNVGIGTSNPSALLHVKGSGSAETKLTIDSGSSNHAACIGFSADNERAKILGGYDSGGGGFIKFNTDTAAGTATDRMIIDNEGNVGIGTTNPSSNHKLHIRHTETANFRIERNKVGHTNSQNGYLQITAAEGSNLIYSKDLDGNAKNFVIDGGNVGIGTTNPAVKLEVVNSASANIAQFSSTSSNLGGYILIQGSSEAGSAGNLFVGNGKPLVTGSSDASAAIRASTELLFSIGAVEKMRISSDGNVGIGTASPFAKLGVELPVNTDLTTGLFVRNNSSHSASGGSNIAAFHGPNDYVMQVKCDGRVGIGTTNPIAALNIAGVTADADAFTISRVEDNAIPLLRIFQDSTWQVGGVGQGSGIAHINTNNRNLAITTSDDGDLTEGLFINLGKVGIGTLSPEVDLHVRNKESHGQSTLKLQGNNTGGFCSAIIFTNSDQTDSGSISYNADDNYMRFNTGGLSTTTERLRIHNNGVISTNGITNPLGTVHFTKSGGGNSNRQLQYNTTFDSNETNGWCSLVNAGASTGATGVFQNNRSATIGTAANATYNTDMFGLLYLQKESGANTYLWVDNSQNWRTATSFTYAGSDAGGTVIGTQTSDERLKNISQEFDYGIEHVLQLQPITYTRKDDTDSVQRLGFGAQTTQQVIPEAVYDTGDCVDGYDTDPDDETKSVPKSDDTILAMEYVQLVPVLTKAIQQQQAMIDAQNQRIDTLEQRLQTLENK